MREIFAADQKSNVSLEYAADVNGLVFKTIFRLRKKVVKFGAAIAFVRTQTTFFVLKCSIRKHMPQFNFFISFILRAFKFKIQCQIE